MADTQQVLDSEERDSSIERLGIRDLIRSAAREAAETSVSERLTQREKSEVHEWSVRILLVTLSVVLAIVPVFLLLDRYQVIQLVGAPDLPPGAAAAATPAGITDMIGILIPVLTVLVAFFLGSTGLKRLQLYDAELSQNRRERREEMESLRSQLARDMDRAEQNGREAATQQAVAMRADVMQSSRKVVEDAMIEFEYTLSQVRSGAEDTLNSVQKRVADLDWILKDKDMEEKLTGESMSSMGELHIAITELFQKGERTAAKTLFSRYFGSDDGEAPTLRGSPGDFFNTATQLAQVDLEPLAYRAMEGGLHLYPDNPDLLANGMNWALLVGKRERARELYERARSLPDSAKNWRLWVFMGDYLENTASTKDLERYYLDGYMGRFFGREWELLEDQPKDSMVEKMFAKLANHYLHLGRVREAEQVVRVALTHIEKVPQCASILSGILLERGDLEEAIIFADRAIGDDAQDQSNVNISSLQMKKGNAFDKLLFRSVNENVEPEEMLGFARRALYSYGRCLSAKDLIPNFPSQISTRVNAIVGKLEDLGFSGDVIRSLVPETLLRLLPPILLSGSAGSADSDNQSEVNSIQNWVLRVKDASGRPEAEGASLLQDIAEEIRENGLEIQVRGFFQHLAQELEADNDERAFVDSLRALLSQLSE